jgi:iron complex outermembrane receptor protein
VVKDGNGAALPGASVILEGTRTGTTTDANGTYVLKAPPGNYTIIVSFVGTGAQRIPITIKAGETVEKDVSITAVTDLSGGSNCRIKIKTSS